MRKQIKQNRAITLITLVITIIILIILAGVTINLTIGENGIFNKAKQGTENYMIAANEEQAMLANLDIDNLINENTNLNELYINKLNNLELITSKFTYDAIKSTITYTATEKVTLLAVGNGTSTHSDGTTYCNINSTGTIKTLVYNNKMSANSYNYSSIYAYQINLNKDDTLTFEVWSNQGNTSNTTMLFLIK